MTKFVINGKFLSRQMTGVDRFAFELTSAIDRFLEQGEFSAQSLQFRIVVPEGADVGQPFSKIKVHSACRTKGLLWEQVELPFHVRKGECLLSFCNTGPVFFKDQVVAIHDAATVRTPHAFSRGFRLWYRFAMPLLGRTAKKILTVSEFSKREIVDCFGVTEEKVEVVSEGAGHIRKISSCSEVHQKFGLEGKPYLLAVSSMAAHKNFRLVLEALKLLDNPPFEIVIAGGANSRVFGDAGSLRSGSVKWLGYVSDAELRALYENAMAFVFPSIYEGFGIPPLEAMACGCPVLASTAASIPEVCGNAALYFDPRSAEQLAKLMLRVTGDAQLRADLREKGYRQSEQFSWELGARQLLEVCSELSDHAK